jgi:hypothetical protein
MLKFEGDTIYDGSKRVGELRGDFFDGHGNKVGFFRGNQIYDAHGSKVGVLHGENIFDRYGAKTGTLRDVKRVMTGEGSMSMAAAWLLFLRK